MKKVWFAIVGALGFVVIGTSIYISTINWNEHKDKISQQFSEMTGKVVVFEGSTDFVLFPRPYLTVSQVAIYNPNETGVKPLAKIESLVAKLSLIPLIKGEFEVEKMSLVNPVIEMDFNENGDFNWVSSITEEQKEKLRTTDVTLKSVMLENGKINFNDVKHHTGFTLTKLNAEVIADKLTGPYRIEGNYTRDNNPEGFAISIGDLAPNFATSLNFVLTHPSSKSFVRFDGTFLLQNSSINGNVIFETQKLMDFVKANFPNYKFDPQYDYPLALSLELNSNKTKLDLSGIVLKYGETAGAGSISVPYVKETFDYDIGNENTMERKQVNLAFDLTHIDLAPIVYTINSILEEYKKPEVAYAPQTNFDLIGDIKAVKGSYNEEVLQKLNLSFDWVNNVFKINDFDALLPGDTSASIKGEIYSNEEELTYDLESEFNSTDFVKTLHWIGIDPTINAAATYKKASGSADFAGTFDKVQISPFKLNIDKSMFEGEAGIKFGKRTDSLIKIKADMINFDNYIPSLPVELAEKSFEERLNYRFSKLGFLNDIDMQLIASLDLGIYENMPFENTSVDFTLMDGMMDIKELKINNIAQSNLDASGILRGFGKIPSAENIKYTINTTDVASLFNKFDLKAPNINLKELKKASLKGIVTGGTQRFATQSSLKLEQFDLLYKGEINQKNNIFNFIGKIDAKHPDFIKMLNDFNINYKPNAISLGLFNLKSSINGNKDYMRLHDIKANIGFNEFVGKVDYSHNNNHPNYVCKFDINKFEIDRFFYNPNEKKQDIELDKKSINNGSLWAKPVFDNTKFDYSFYNKFDFAGNFTIKDLSYKNKRANNASFNLNLVNGFINLSNFKSEYNGGNLSANVELVTKDKPFISGNADFSNLEIARSKWSGKVYGITGGIITAKNTFKSPANSAIDIIENLDANSKFELSNFKIKGINLDAIKKDLENRKNGDGLLAFATEKLQSGSTPINKLNAEIDIKKSQGKFLTAVFTSDDFDMGLNSSFNLNKWDMESKFTVKYNSKDFMPNFDFSLNGSIDNPQLTANMEAYLNMYQQEINKIEADKKKAEEDRINKLVLAMNQQKIIFEAINRDFVENTLSTFNKNKDYSKKPNIVGQYNNIEKQIEKLQKHLSDISAMTLLPDVTTENINNVEAMSKQASQQLEMLKSSLQKTHILALKENMNDEFNALTNNYDNNKKAMFNFNAKLERLKTRLSKIITNYTIEKDDLIKKLLAENESSIADAEKLNTEIFNKYNFVKTSTDATEISKFNEDMQKNKAKVDVTYANINSNLDKLEKYATERVEIEEEAYEQKLRDEEVKRKLEENTGSISIKQSGKNIEVIRDIKEIEESEELQDSNKLKVLDFSTTSKISSKEKNNSKSKTQVKDFGKAGTIIRK